MELGRFLFGARGFGRQRHGTNNVDLLRWDSIGLRYAADHVAARHVSRKHGGARR
jgi:hypothetical protein